jgi:hypothetical protein
MMMSFEIQRIIFPKQSAEHSIFDFAGENIEVNAPARTEDPDNQTNDIAKSAVSTGRDARTVRAIPEYFNTPSEARHSQRRRTQKMKRMTGKKK